MQKDSSTLNLNDQGEIEIDCSSEILNYESSHDNEFSQTQQSTSEQYISKDKKGIWYSHLVSSSTGTLSCNILWEERETFR